MEYVLADDVLYTQKACSRILIDGRPLDDLIRDLDALRFVQEGQGLPRRA